MKYELVLPKVASDLIDSYNETISAREKQIYDSIVTDSVYADSNYKNMYIRKAGELISTDSLIRSCMSSIVKIHAMYGTFKYTLTVEEYNKLKQEIGNINEVD